MKFKKLAASCITAVMFLSSGVGAYAAEVSPSDVSAETPKPALTFQSSDKKKEQIDSSDDVSPTEIDKDFTLNDQLKGVSKSFVVRVQSASSVMLATTQQSDAHFSDELIDSVAERMCDMTGSYVSVSTFGINADQDTVKALMQAVAVKYPVEYDTASVKSWTYSASGGKLIKIKFTYSLNQTVQEFNNKVSAVNSKCTQICNRFVGKSDFEKIVGVHNYLIENAYYKNSGDDNCRTAYTLLINHFGVCEGYTDTFGILMKKMNIPCIAVVSEEMNHTWNMVKYNGNWYHIDVTWDDPVITGLDLSERSGYEGYTYFLQNDDGIQSLEHSNWTTDVVSASGAFADMPRNKIYEQSVNDDRWYTCEGSTLLSTDIYGGSRTVIADDVSGGTAEYDDIIYYGSGKNIKRYSVKTAECDAPYTMPSDEGAGLPSSLPVNIVSLSVVDGVLGYTYKSWKPAGDGYYSSVNLDSSVKINLNHAGFVKSVALDQTSVSLACGNTFAMNASTNPSSSCAGVVWSSSDESVATVSDGVITAKQEGHAVITASVGFFKAECELEVTQPTAVNPECSFTASLQSPQNQNTSILLTAAGGTKYRFYCECNGVQTDLQSISETSEYSWKPSNPGTYHLYVDIIDNTDNIIATKSIEYIITEIAPSLKITAQPENKTVAVGDSVTFSVAAEGEGLTYQWYYRA